MTLNLVVDVDIYRWLPPDPPNYVENSCSRQYQDFQQRAREHEAGHVADDEALLKQYQQSERLPAIRFCGADDAAAATGIQAELLRAQETISKRFKDESEQRGRAYHQAHGETIAPMDCGGCP